MNVAAECVPHQPELQLQNRKRLADKKVVSWQNIVKIGERTVHPILTGSKNDR